MKYALTLIFSFLLLNGCASGLTQAEIETQNKADIVVSEVLFDKQMEEKASYFVRKDGSVKILFAKDVSFIDYNEVVNQLRKSDAIRSVYAEKDGEQVCPLK